MLENQNGALVDCVEAGRAAGVDARTIRKWTKTDHPELGVVAGGRLYIRRSELEKILGRSLSGDDAPRVSVVYVQRDGTSKRSGRAFQKTKALRWIRSHSAG